MKCLGLLSLGMIVLISSCAKFQTINGFTQGTTYHIIYRKKGHPVRIEEVNKTQIDSILAGFDQSLSEYIPNSILSRLNRNDLTVKMDQYFIDVFNKSEEIYEATRGAFDITVAPLVDAWGFGPKSGTFADSVNVDSLLQYVGMDKVTLQNNRVVKSDTNVTIDVNAIAQGYSVDVVANYLMNKGFNNYLVEIGGEVRTGGTKSRLHPWKVGVDKPFENPLISGEALQVILKLKDASLATSGNYRKFYEKDGVKYGHTINPVSGYPVMDKLLSASIVAPDCMTADGYATACMVMGLGKSMDFVEANKELEAYFIYSGPSGEFKTWYSSGFKKYIFKEE